MKAYRDVFKKPLNKDEVQGVVLEIIRANNPTTSFIARRFKWGFGKAMVMLTLLDDAGVISPAMRGRRTIILKDPKAAVNAALRQLKKGRK